jgi:hypothetical protein
VTIQLVHIFGFVSTDTQHRLLSGLNLTWIRSSWKKMLKELILVCSELNPQKLESAESTNLKNKPN